MKYLAALLCMFSPLAMAEKCFDGNDYFDCFGNGTAAKPSLSVGNMGTGLFSHGHGDLRFSVLGIEVAYFDPEGHFILLNPVIPPPIELFEAGGLAISGTGTIVGGLTGTPIGQSDPAPGTFTILNAADIRVNGQPLVSSVVPTIASGFGGLPSVNHSNGTASFSVLVGGSIPSSKGVIGMPTAKHGWACSVADVTHPDANSTQETGSSPSSVTLTNYARTTGLESEWPASDVLQLSCFPN